MAAWLLAYYLSLKVNCRKIERKLINTGLKLCMETMENVAQGKIKSGRAVCCFKMLILGTTGFSHMK